MLFLAIGMYLVTFEKVGVGANFGEGGPEKQLFFYHGLKRNVFNNTWCVILKV